MSKQPLNRALVEHSKPQPGSSTPRKRPTFRPKEGWLTYNLNHRVDQSVILTSFVALVDGLDDSHVWAHYEEGRRGTNPRLILKLLAVRFLFQLSGARALGMAEILRAPLNLHAAVFPVAGTLDYRLRSGVFDHLLDHLLTLSVTETIDNKVAVDSTGFSDRRNERRQWSTHGKKHPRGWRKAHLCSGTESHRVYAITITPGETGDATQAKQLITDTRKRSRHPRKIVGDNAYASREILTHAEQHGLQPTMKLRPDATLKSNGHPPHGPEWSYAPATPPPSTQNSTTRAATPKARTTPGKTE